MQDHEGAGLMPRSVARRVSRSAVPTTIMETSASPSQVGTASGITGGWRARPGRRGGAYFTAPAVSPET